MGVARLDWQKSDKHSINVRPFVTNLDTPSTYDGKNVLTANSYAMNFRVYSLAFGDTYLINNTMVNSFHFGINRSNAIKIPDKPGFSWVGFGVNAPYQPTPNPRFTISGGNGYSFESGAAVTTDHGGPNFNVNEDFSWVRRTHQIAFGGTYNHVILNYASGTIPAARCHLMARRPVLAWLISCWGSPLRGLRAMCRMYSTIARTI